MNDLLALYGPPSDELAPGAGPPAIAPGKTVATARLAPRTMVLRFADGGPAAGADALVARASAGGGQPLPASLRERFEGSLGADLSAVRVHTDGDSATAAAALGARAYTVGQDVHFAAGHYQPDDPFGAHLLAHEVVHTVQQNGGAAARAVQPALEVSSPGDSHEVEAEALAPRLVRGEPVAVSGVSATVARTVMRSPDRASTQGTNGKLTLAKWPVGSKIPFGPLTIDSSISAEVGYEQVQKAAPAGGASTSARPGGNGPNTDPAGGVDSRSGAGADRSKGAVGISQEIKVELEQGVRQQILDVRCNFTEASEVTTRGAKFGGSFNLETKAGPVPLKLKVIELNVVKIDNGGNPPIRFGVATVGVEAQLAELEHVASDGMTYKLKPTVKLELECQPDPAKIGKFVLENMTRIFASELALAGGLIAGGVMTIGTALYQIANSGEITERTEYAVRKCQAYCRAYEAAIKGEPPPGGDGAAEGTAAGQQWVAARQLAGPDSGALIAVAARGLNLYKQAWAQAWPKIRSKAIADYWADHKVEHLIYGDDGAGSGGFKTFRRVLDAVGNG